ncbi:MAG: CheY-P-specific phosphatase CheC [Candidatus Omnitrophota bacterium]|mgnify:CR=1 FL=1|nr:MAG: CheY-P-specific phosphatase CheC [Candidatus Omnitrophota bacterium]
MEEIKFNEFQKDALREIGSICAGNAATALSQLTNKKIEINVPEIYFLPVEKVPQIVGEERLVVGLIVRILGDFPSVVLLIFSHKDALGLASLLTSRKPSNGGVITDMERSALKEIGVILANAYLGALSVFVKWGLVPTVPEIIEDMAGAMVDYILIELGNISSYALLIKSEFKEITTKITGHFFLLPNPKGLEILLKATEI